MKNAAHILIIEDDTEIARLVQINLEDEGYEVKHIRDGLEGYHNIQSHSYDLIILDLMLPRMNGIEICKKFRARDASTPLLMLTAKSEEFDKVLGLELGADDYLTKPFGIRELLARIKALLRRSRQLPPSGDSAPERERMVFGDLVIEPDKHRYGFSFVNADIQLTERALSNLLQNAIHYTETGGNIVLSVREVDQQVQIAVSDNGCGIPQEELSLIFNRFYRGKNDQSRSRGSSGLGLAITQRILELHNFTLKVESEEEVGTTFYFHLEKA